MIVLSTTDTTLLVILILLMSLYFALCAVALVFIIKILASVKRVVLQAENVVDSVEAAAEVLKDASGKLAVVKILKNIVDLGQRKK